MKFSISSAKLLGVVMAVGRAVGNNPVLPIIECLLFQIKSNQLTVTATDLEMTIRQGTDVKSNKDGSIAIPYKILQDTLKALPNQPIQFEVNENNGITITSEYGKYKLVGDDPKDFPQLPKREEVQSLEIKAGVLPRVIKHTAFALSKDELRPAMTGLYVSCGNGLEFVSTDAHKLARVKVALKEPLAEGHFIIPSKGINVMKDVAENLSIDYNKANIFFQTEHIEVICRLIDARYPAYNAIIPTNNPHRLVVDAEDCKQTLKRIAIYANKTTNQVVLDIQAKELNIQANASDFDCSAQETIVADYSGEPMKTAYNARFLVESIAALGNVEECVFHLSSPTSAALLKPYSKEEMDVTILVMPLMLSA